MSIVLRLPLLILFVTSLPAQIYNLATDATGRDVYLETTLSQRGSSQPAVSKIFLLRGGVLRLLEQTQTASPFGPGTYAYTRVTVSANGAVRTLNRFRTGPCPDVCPDYRLASTTIQAPYATLTFAASSVVSANGRYAALFGNKEEAPGIPAHSVQLLNLESGQLTLAGPQAAQFGRIVSEDGTVLVARGDGVRLVGPNRNIDLTPMGAMYNADLAGDSSRIVYDQISGTGIRVIEVSTGLDKSLGTGYLPTLAQDGRTFSYLRLLEGSVQVWLGDAATGSTRPLSHEAESITGQTITGNGAAVIAATAAGRLLSIDIVSGAITQLLGSTSFGGLLTKAVPGSYNEIAGLFPEDFIPDVRIGRTPAIVLGRSLRGLAIQIPWEAQPDPTTLIFMSSPEPLWDKLIGFGVYPLAAAALPVGAGGPGGPAYYALHQDWSGPVTALKPAHHGEVIHLYGTGYGPVDGTVPTGTATPSDRLYRMTSACVWKALGVINEPRPIDVEFAGLAPGLTGIYQFDFRIPLDWPYPVFNAYCEFAPGNFLPTSAIYGIQQP